MACFESNVLCFMGIRRKGGRGGGKRPIRSRTAPLCSGQERRVSFPLLFIIHCAPAGRNYLQKRESQVSEARPGAPGPGGLSIPLERSKLQPCHSHGVCIRFPRL